MIEYERTNLNGVPDYTAVEFEGRRHDYCLLIPVINEGARILTELGRAQKAGIDQLCDIVICDGGSTDGSMKRETLGGGDIKLLFLTGLFFGWKGNLLCLVLACVVGIVWGLAGKRRGEAIPWGPSIAVGAWITALAGQPFINWYLGFFA